MSYTQNSTTPFRIVVLASTNGTDLQAIIDEMQAGQMPGIELSAVMSNKKCYALERAHTQGYPTHYLNPKGKTKEQFDQELLATLAPINPDLIVLVGYMRILTPAFIQAYPHKIINVHPSLIPKYSDADFYGSNVHQAVLDNNESETGMTIHYVDEGVDTGEIIVQKACAVAPADTTDTLKTKVQALEKKWYPEVIRQIAAQTKA